MRGYLCGNILFPTGFGGSSSNGTINARERMGCRFDSVWICDKSTCVRGIQGVYASIKVHEWRPHLFVGEKAVKFMAYLLQTSTIRDIVKAIMMLNLPIHLPLFTLLFLQSCSNCKPKSTHAMLSANKRCLCERMGAGCFMGR